MRGLGLNGMGGYVEGICHHNNKEENCLLCAHEEALEMNQEIDHKREVKRQYQILLDEIRKNPPTNEEIRDYIKEEDEECMAWGHGHYTMKDWRQLWNVNDVLYVEPFLKFRARRNERLKREQEQAVNAPVQKTVIRRRRKK